MADFQLNFSGDELNEVVQKVQELPVGPTDRDLSNLSGAGKQVIKTLAEGASGGGSILDEDGKVPVDKLPEEAVIIPNTASGLGLEKLNSLEFKVAPGFCTCMNDNTVINLSDTTSKKLEPFSRGANKGAINAIAGNVIPTLTENTSSISLIKIDGNGKVSDYNGCNDYNSLYRPFDGNTSSGVTIHNTGRDWDQMLLRYEFENELPPGEYTFKGITGKTWHEDVLLLAAYVEMSDGSVMTLFYGRSTNEKEVLEYPFTAKANVKAIRFGYSNDSFWDDNVIIYYMSVIAKPPKYYDVNLISDNEGNTDVSCGTLIPEGFEHIKRIGKIYLNEDGTIKDVFPKVDIATMFSNYDLVTKEDLANEVSNLTDTISTLEKENTKLKGDLKKLRNFVNPSSYEIDLNPNNSYGWKEATVTNPKPEWKMYESNNMGANSTTATMKVTIKGYTKFTYYINSYAESSYDYTIASEIDSTSEKVSTRSFQKEPNVFSTSNWKTVTYDNLNGEEHFFYVSFRKDGSGNSYLDRGFLLIPDEQEEGGGEPTYLQIETLQSQVEALMARIEALENPVETTEE